MTPLESSHEYFERLCALWATNQISPAEQDSLAEHTASCSECRHAMAQYGQIVVQMNGEVASSSLPLESSADTSDPDADQLGAKERLFTSVKKQATRIDPEKIRIAATNENQSALTGQLARPARVVAGWAAAAVILLGLGIGLPQYWLIKRHSAEAESKAKAMQNEIQELRARLAEVRTERQQPTNVEPEENKKLESLSAANETLRLNLADAQMARQREAADNADLRDRLRMAQSSLDVLQAGKTNTEAEKAALAERIASLTAEARKSQDELARITARNEELSQQAFSRIRYLERQQKLLATDHDIRDILGSRSLRIIDVYDVTSQGEFEQPFGRIFYTEGQSLIFYAFDLDQQKGAKHGAVFQAWGQKGEGKGDPLSLGAFYMDDPSQNRWVLKVDDGKALSHVEYVFVTDSSRKEGSRPKGKPLLSAFLRNPSDHP